MNSDVIVVGAGIIGAACAYRLAASGLKTLVIESASSPATGSTGRSAAGVRVQFSHETNVRLSWESIKEYRAFEDLYGESAEYRPLGYLFLVPPEKMASHMAGLAVQQSVGAPAQLVSIDDAQRFVPFDARNVAAATFGASDGVIDPHRVTFTYLRLAKVLSCEVYLDSPLLQCHREGGTWRVSTPSDQHEAPYIVNAAGPWSGVVGERAGLEVPVSPMRRMVFSTSPTFPDCSYPLTVDVESGFYLRSEGQRVLMGRSNPEETAGFHEGIDWEWLESVLSPGIGRFPWLQHAGLDRKASWWGYYEVTPDHNPVLGAMPEVEGWINACGFSGHGVQQAAAVGRVIAEEIIDGRATSIDIDAFRIERFASADASREATEDHIV